MIKKKIVISKLHGYDVYRGVKIVIDGSETEVNYKKEIDDPAIENAHCFFNVKTNTTTESVIIESSKKVSLKVKDLFNNF